MYEKKHSLLDENGNMLKGLTLSVAKSSTWLPAPFRPFVGLLKSRAGHLSQACWTHRLRPSLQYTTKSTGSGNGDCPGMERVSVHFYIFFIVEANWSSQPRMTLQVKSSRRRMLPGKSDVIERSVLQYIFDDLLKVWLV
jgi:hypothetical protein